MQATTLTALMQANRNAERSITYLEGEKDVRRVVTARSTNARSAFSTICSASAPGRATS